MQHRMLRVPTGALIPLVTAALAVLPLTLDAQQGGGRDSGRATGLPAGKPAVKPAAKPATTAKPATAARPAPRDTVERLPNGKRKPRGWPVAGPAPLPGSILPSRRIVAFYGNPLSKRMGVLGEYEVETMLAKLDGEVARWRKADPSTPVQPALHLIAVVAAGEPGPSGK